LVDLGAGGREIERLTPLVEKSETGLKLEKIILCLENCIPLLETKNRL